MTCMRCHMGLEDDSAFCRHCGLASPGGRSEPRRLYRRPEAGRLGGVCAGLADYFTADVTLVRILWVVLSIVPGGLVGGVVAYVMAAIIMPAAPGGLAAADASRRRLTRSLTERKVAGVCGGLAAAMGVDPTMVRLGWVLLTIFPGAIVLGLVAYAVAWFVMPEEQPMSAIPATAAA